VGAHKGLSSPRPCGSRLGRGSFLIPALFALMARFSYNSVTIVEPHSANVPEQSVKTEDLEGR
jgi:hypothetical protein